MGLDRFRQELEFGVAMESNSELTGMMTTRREVPTQAESRLSLQAVAQLVDLAEDAILSVDEAGRIVLFNRGAERTFGYVAAEILGQPLDLLIPVRFHAAHPDQMRSFADGPRSARPMGERRPVHGRRKDGTEFPAEVTISRFRDEGRLVLNAIVRDVTDRVRASEEIQALNRELEARVKSRTADLAATTQQLWQAAKLASIGELAASVAHELNNPLGTVSLRLESILARFPTDDPVYPALQVIEGEVERMARLITNLLQFSRVAEDQLSTVVLPEEVARTADLIEHLFRRRQVGAVFDFAPDLPTVVADRQKLRQVFLNLYSNALDAMPHGGTLTTRIQTGVAPNGTPALVVEVIDTGVGIPPEIISRVMEPFFTTKDESHGTGLGLAICRRILQDQQGTIQLASEVGQGTTVRLTLPLRRTPDTP